MPSSLTVIHPSASVYSTRLRVSVCGTGTLRVKFSGFSRQSDYLRCWIVPKDAPYFQVRLSPWICLWESTPTPLNGLFRQPAAVPLLRLHVTSEGSNGMLTVSAIGLISVDQETLVFRRGGFPPPLSLLIPTFAFPYAPEHLAVRLRRRMECSPTDTYISHGFGMRLIPDYYPRPVPRLVSCYALFK